MIALTCLRHILKHAISNFNFQKQQTLNKNRRIWSAVLITIYLKRRMRKQGSCTEERLRQQIRYSLTWRATSIQESHIAKARLMMHAVLLSTSKRRQFMLKLNLTMTRVINLQQRSRVYVFKKKN